MSRASYYLQASYLIAEGTLAAQTVSECSTSDTKLSYSLLRQQAILNGIGELLESEDLSESVRERILEVQKDQESALSSILTAETKQMENALAHALVLLKRR